VITDIRTVMWKELRESMVRPRGGGRAGGVFSLLFNLLFLGVMIPASSAPGWAGVPAIAVSAGAAMMIAMTQVPDSFAGERDRKTLETLLASRLPDRAILLGKIGAATLMGVVMAALVLVVSLVTANVADHRSGLQLYSVLDVVAALGAALLAGTLVANIGVMVSLRAPSATAAARAMALGTVAVIFGTSALFSTLPKAWKGDLERLARESGTDEPVVLVLAAVMALVVVNAVLLQISSRLFRRPKLIKA
jgi:ABC-2 type transport system permease protein